MNKKVIYGGICAATLVFTAAISVISCSNDEEYYEGGNYTLAKQRLTRGVEPGGAGVSTPVCSDTTYANYDFRFSACLDAPVTIHMMIYRQQGKPVAHMLSYTLPYAIELADSTFRITGVGFEEDNIMPKRYFLCAYATDSLNTIHKATVLDRIFF